METAAATKLKREKGEGLNSIKTVKKGSAACNSTAQYLVVLWLEGRIPRNRLGSRRSQATGGKAVPLLEGHLVETVEATWSQQTPEGRHIRWCWGKVVKGEAWCQMCVAIFQGPETLLLHYLVNFFWGGLAPGHSLRAPAAAGSSKHSWEQLTFGHCSFGHRLVRPSCRGVKRVKTAVLQK